MIPKIVCVCSVECTQLKEAIHFEGHGMSYIFLPSANHGILEQALAFFNHSSRRRFPIVNVVFLGFGFYVVLVRF